MGGVLITAKVQTNAGTAGKPHVFTLNAIHIEIQRAPAKTATINPLR